MGPRWLARRCLFLGFDDDAVGTGGDGIGALHWDQGLVSAKHPSNVLIAKMCELARLLEARVQGDDGEYYGS